MKYFTRLAVAAVLIMFPAVASADTTADLAAQAQALLNQVAALQAQLAAQGGITGSVTSPSTPSRAACPLIGRVLKIGSSGDDVTRLQQFLASDPGVYPEALITGYYGGLTEAAVKRWQVKYNIVSSGTAETTGYGVTGPRTAAAISLQCTNGTGGLPASGPVGGFMQVSPIAGNAPLTVNVKATVNTAASCSGGTYSLSWGDGTVVQTLSVPSGTCSQIVQNYSHQYVYGGVYTITLSAGTHQSSTSVVVSGAGAPSNTSPVTPLSISVSSSAAGATVQRGSAITISWNSIGSVPANSSVMLDLFTPNGQKVVSGDVIGISSALSGSTQWTVPTGSGACTAIYPGGLCSAKLVNGAYVIHATINQSTNGTSVGNVIAAADSAAFTIGGAAGTTANYTYGPLAVTPNVSGNPLTVTASFDLPSSCTGYDLSWGDTTSHVSQSNSASCASGAVTKTFTHTYTGAGSYTIYLQRGSDLSQASSVSLVISN